MINYVVSNGCSWMEQHNNERDLAKHFALKYNICTEADHNNNRHINLSIGGGSNDRILRTTTEWIMNNQDKVKETFILIGLTYIPRTEEFSVSRDTNPPVTSFVKMNDILIEEKFMSHHSFDNDYKRTIRTVINLVSIFEYYGVGKYLIFDAVAKLKDSPMNEKLDIHNEEFTDTLIDWSTEYPSLDSLFDNNPNVYLDKSFDEFCGGVNTVRKFSKWQWNSGIAYNDLDGMYERGDLGHPSAKAVKLWFEHLDKYMESN